MTVGQLVTHTTSDFDLFYGNLIAVADLLQGCHISGNLGKNVDGTVSPWLTMLTSWSCSEEDA